MVAVTAILMGLFGSLHCVAMCSPLSIAVTRLSAGAFINRTLYNGGRIFTYSILGSLFTSVVIPLAAFQNVIGVVVGTVLLIAGLVKTRAFKIPFLSATVQNFVIFIKTNFSAILTRRNSRSFFLLGMLNGFLPCGLSFIALAYCITLKGPMDGFLFMSLFGLGTLPAMLGGATAITVLVHKLQWKVSNVNMNLLIFSGALLIARVFWLASMEAHQTGANVVDIVLCR